MHAVTHLPFSQVWKFTRLGEDSATVFVLPENSSLGGGPSIISHARGDCKSPAEQQHTNDIKRVRSALKLDTPW